MAVSGSSNLVGAKKCRCSETWGTLQYFLAIGGFCLLIWTLWLAREYATLQSLKSFWQKPDDQDLAATWQDSLINISIVSSALATGAVCLDGSPPAYFLARGSGKGVNNWLVFLEGGGWCNSDEDCLRRSFTGLGSSRFMPKRSRMEGVLSGSPAVNPDFYNWNRVLVKYCDGGSFNGYVHEPKLVKINPTKWYSEGGKYAELFYRGQAIWKAVMEDLLNKGMQKAQKAFLAGCSAGGLASVLHCDQFRDIMPSGSTVKCLSDAGFFLNVVDVRGFPVIEEFYKEVVHLQNMTGNLPEACTSQRIETKCIFPQYLISNMRTPFFVLNPAYDSWQFANILVPPFSDPEGSWRDCRNALTYCSESQMKIVQGFRDDLLKALAPLMDSEKDGACINSCYLHCQSQDNYSWNGGQKVDNKSFAKIVGDWYFGRNSTKVVDCPFPCNPTC